MLLKSKNIRMKLKKLNILITGDNMEIIMRSIIMFIVLFIIVKILGTKQIKNLTLYDYVLSITIGSIAADTIISLDTPLFDGILALIIFGIIGYLSSLLSYYNHSVEEIMDGEPLILFENNNFNYDNLETAKLSVAKVLENCRLKGCFDINELDCAVLEPSGDVSILLKGNSQPITSNDLKTNIQKNSKKQTLNHIIIVDGVLNENELKKAQKNKTWLNQYLKQHKKSLENISLLSIDKNNKITMFNKN